MTRWSGEASLRNHWGGGLADRRVVRAAHVIVEPGEENSNLFALNILLQMVAAVRHQWSQYQGVWPPGLLFHQRRQSGESGRTFGRPKRCCVNMSLQPRMTPSLSHDTRPLRLANT